jgi:hypothetical protein
MHASRIGCQLRLNQFSRVPSELPFGVKHDAVLEFSLYCVSAIRHVGEGGDMYGEEFRFGGSFSFGALSTLVVLIDRMVVGFF